MPEPQPPSLSPYVGGFLTIIGGIWAASAAWSEINARVEKKADASVVQELRTEMHVIQRQNAQIIRFLCQSRPSDLGCQP